MLDMLKKYDGGGADEIRLQLDRFSMAPHKFDAVRRRNLTAPRGSINEIQKFGFK
jgi:hypothetical protein